MSTRFQEANTADCFNEWRGKGVLHREGEQVFKTAAPIIRIVAVSGRDLR